MGTILNSIAIICLTIAFILHIKKFHKPIRFDLTIEELKRANELQTFLEKTRNDVRSSNRDTKSK